MGNLLRSFRRAYVRPSNQAAIAIHNLHHEKTPRTLPIRVVFTFPAWSAKLMQI